MQNKLILTTILIINSAVVVPITPGGTYNPEFETKYIETYKQNFVSFIEKKIDREIEFVESISANSTIEFVYKTKEAIRNKVSNLGSSVRINSMDTTIEGSFQKSEYSINTGGISAEVSAKFGVGCSVPFIIQVEDTFGLGIDTTITESKIEKATSRITICYPTIIKDDLNNGIYAVDVYNSLDVYLKNLYYEENGVYKLGLGDYTFSEYNSLEYYYSFKVKKSMTYKVNGGVETEYYSTYVLYGDTNRFIVDENNDVTVRKDIIENDVSYSTYSSNFSYYELEKVKITD